MSTKRANTPSDPPSKNKRRREKKKNEVPAEPVTEEEFSTTVKSRSGTKWTVGLIVFSVLSFLTRFHNLGYPHSVVFDEVHFGWFTQNYLKGEFFFDIHPPLGKFFLLWMAWLRGTQLEDYDFHEIGSEFPDNEYVYLRAVSATFATLTVPVLYLTLKALGCSFRACALVTGFLVLEGLFLTESRYILTDSCLWFFMALSIYFCVKFWNASNNPNTPAWQYWAWAFVSGLALGAHLSVKWTGLGTVGALGLVQVWRAVWPVLSNGYQLGQGKRIPVNISRQIREFLAGALMLVVLVLFYYSMWVLHLHYVPNTGTGDGYHSRRFQASIVGNPNYGNYKPGEYPMSTFERIYTIHVDMFRTNSGLSSPHDWGSVWYQWPFQTAHGVFLWSLGEIQIWNSENYFVSFITTLSIISYMIYLMFIQSLDRNVTSKEMHNVSSGMWLLMGYIVNLLPYIKITRVCFMYHYAPSYYWGLVLVAVNFDRLITNKELQKYVCAFGLIGAIITFILCCP
eukprot:CAMPEP_0174249772 /NCGR_PEP_ID=MMETSP0439-20130205/118_1 /TAXON_ID=0 /ORGANISM="Stereomyxa ramosa, Strain Chinc5" /LENGTH=509 /DNA_ID=CAMNT_0015329675 /DNA_START=40 /DNA_END=1566 /DNA_ORIENTATION=+